MDFIFISTKACWNPSLKVILLIGFARLLQIQPKHYQLMITLPKVAHAFCFPSETTELHLLLPYLFDLSYDNWLQNTLGIDFQLYF